MKPTYLEVMELIAALNHLGGTYNKVVKDTGRDAVFSVPYRFGAKSQSVRSAAARNLRLLKPHAAEFKDLSNALLMELSEGRGTIGDDEKELLGRYSISLNKLEKTSVPEQLDLQEIPEADLDLENNPIPPSVVASLALLAVAIPTPKGDA